MSTSSLQLKIATMQDDADELSLLESFEAGAWASVSDEAADIARYRAAASKALLKNKRVNIRLSSMDLEGLQAKAAQEGLPYKR
jgi:predicted DNA binding CopG/RHH family protein